jgi:hypothetical protein
MRGFLHPVQDALNVTQNSLYRSQSTARSFGVQRRQLLTESQVFEQKVFPGTESADHPAEKMPEQHDKGKNFIGIARIQLFAKSLILWVYDVLARHSPPR